MERKELLDGIKNSFLNSTLPGVGINAVWTLVSRKTSTPKEYGIEVGMNALSATTAMLSDHIIEFCILNCMDKKKLNFERRIYVNMAASWASSMIDSAIFAKKYTLWNMGFGPILNASLNGVMFMISNVNDSRALIKEKFPDVYYNVAAKLDEAGIPDVSVFFDPTKFVNAAAMASE